MEEIEDFDPPMKTGTLDHIGGRKPLPDHKKRKRRVLYLTDREWQCLIPAIAKVRQEDKPHRLELSQTAY